MSTVSNSVNSVNSYSAVLPPSPMVFFLSALSLTGCNQSWCCNFEPGKKIGVELHFAGVKEAGGAMHYFLPKHFQSVALG